MYRRNDRGLTLLEILIGITITAAIMAILLSALRLGHRSQEKAGERQELAQRMRIVSDRISWLIRGAFPYMIDEEAGKKTLFFSGTGSTLGLVTTSTDPYSEEHYDQPGLKWVEIFTDDEGLKLRENVFFLKSALEGEGTETLLEPSVTSISFEYLDPGEEITLDTWGQTWQSTEREYLPTAVRVTVTMTYKEQEIEIPPFTAAIRTGGPPD